MSETHFSIKLNKLNDFSNKSDFSREQMINDSLYVVILFYKLMICEINM